MTKVPGTTMLITLFILFCVQLKLAAQNEFTLFLTKTTFEKYQLDKVPFAMRKITVIQEGDKLTAAGKTFSGVATKGGGILYISTDKTSYLLINDKAETVGFIISAGGKEWSCYYKFKKKDKENVTPPYDDSNEEVDALQKAINNIVDPRARYCYITYSTQPTGTSGYAKDSLAFIFISPDTISVEGAYFIKKSDKLYVDRSRTYLYMPDKETFILRDPDISSAALFYQSDVNKANALIARQYKSEKELAATNAAIFGGASSSLKSIVTSYLVTVKSRRNDPALAASVLKYWNSRWAPAYKVIFIDDNFHVNANNLGVPLRKIVYAWVLYKSEGKCFAQLSPYGYEYAGGGAYSKELRQFTFELNKQYVDANTTSGREFLYEGKSFEFDCSSVK